LPAQKQGHNDWEQPESNKTPALIHLLHDGLLTVTVLMVRSLAGSHLFVLSMFNPEPLPNSTSAQVSKISSFGQEIFLP